MRRKAPDCDMTIAEVRQYQDRLSDFIGGPLKRFYRAAP